MNQFKCGIDIGSRNTKLAILDAESSRLVKLSQITTDVSPASTAKKLIESTLADLGISDTALASFASTGYGRHLLECNALSEISCHAAGVHFLIPEARTIIDIGGQDSKIISLSAEGKVKDFVMNDKCAAGTGRFLEMTAIRLGVEISELSDLAGLSNQAHKLSSTCIVFAESEIIGLISQSVSASSIAAAVHRSIAKRIHSQIASLPVADQLVFTGGLARSEHLRLALEAELGRPVHASPNPEYTGAIGAALLARTRS